MTANPANTAFFYFLGHKAGRAFLSHHRSQKKCQDSHCTPVSGIHEVVIILITNKTKCVSTSDKSIAVEKKIRSTMQKYDFKECDVNDADNSLIK